MSCVPGLDWGPWALGCRAGRRAGKRPACINVGPRQGNELSRQWDRSPCGASTFLNPRPTGLSRWAWGPSDLGGGSRRPPQKPSNSGPRLEGPRSQGGGSSGRDRRLELRPCARSPLCPFIRSFTPSFSTTCPGRWSDAGSCGGPCLGGAPSPLSGQREGTGDSGLGTCSGHTTQAGAAGVPPGPSGSRLDLARISASSLLPRGPGVPSCPSPGLSGCFSSLPTLPRGAPSTCCSICQPCFSLPTPPTQHPRSAQTSLCQAVS